jgi:hypothetical protein
LVPRLLLILLLRRRLSIPAIETALLAARLPRRFAGCAPQCRSKYRIPHIPGRE